jgi:glycosyltransferase involved in cell wall biosynthesis
MRILFFMPLGTRSGSEVALHNLISYAAGKDFEMAVACKQEGELLRQLPPNVPVFVYDNWRWDQKTYAGVSSRLRGSDNSFTTSIQKKFKPDLWYINTIIQPEYLLQASKNNIPCVVHTHESEQMLSCLTKAESVALVSYPRLVIASSQTAREVFHALGRRDNIEVCYATINPGSIKSNDEKRRELRRNLNISDDSFVWAMAGSLDPNKNPARFVSVASEMLRNGQDVHFIWIGGSETGYSLYVKEKARESGFAHKISFIGPRADDYYDWLNASDGIVVTSFNESFSLVSVEAAHLGKPVVSFDCGGVKEIVREGMGVVVDSWNNAALICAMEAVMNDEISFDPNLARERVKEFSIDVQGARWVNLMREYFPG